MAVAEVAWAEAALAVGVLLALEGPRASPLVWPEEVAALAPVVDLVAEEVASEVALEVASEVASEAAVASEVEVLEEAALVEAAWEVEALEVLGVLEVLGALEDTLEASMKSPSTRASCNLSM